MLKSVLCLILCYTFLIFVSARFQDFVDAKLKAMPMFNRRYSSSQLEPAGLPGLPGPVRVVFNASLQTTTVATKTIFDIALEKSFFSSLWSNYRKQFSNLGKERFPTFVDNFKTVTTSRLDYKNGLAKFELEMNKFSHLTLEEIRKSYTGARRSKPRLQRSLPHASIKANILESVDYRPYLQPITDQGACGSCVAHAVSAMIEGAYAVKKNICFHLSRQMLIDCGWYTHTCANGSYIDRTLELIKSIGLERTDCFKNAALVTYKRSRGPPPMTMLRNISREQNFRNYLKELSCNGYRKGHPKCFCDVVSCRQGNDYSRIENFERMDILRQQGSDFARILDYHWLSSEDEMLSALNLYGPLTASIRVTKPFYLLGNNPDNIFSVEDCTIRNVKEEGYHAITIVGYGTNHDHVPYWLIRNSWGAQWCDHGYFKMIRGRNMCGIADDAYYVVLQ